ncbi:hypothetical protein GCM10009430_20000 [Aquimarina litoralis]|uniref:F5/8 type C domain-containing protein n=2 Tax=Aquimarina litoralis TaxID=584605 RepID=A0ABN1IRZ0_9FLAO
MLVLTGVSCENEEFIDAEDSIFKDESSLTKADLNPVSVSANGDDGNVPQNTLDGNFNTRWSSNGYTGKYITYDLGSPKDVSSLKIAWYKGNQRKAFFKIRVGNSTSSLVTVFDAKRTGSSGNTTGLEEYSFNTVSARYVRISCFGNSSSSWNSITETRIVGSGGTIDPPPPPPGNTAAAIIGNGWKLNGFSGNLNVGSNDNGLNYADNASKAESHFFFEKDGFAAFRCYPGNPTSGGSSNPRSELREVINGGDNYWNGNTNTEHSMKWRFKIEDLPPSGKLAFGQIHERDDFYDDVIRVQVQGSSGQNSGSVDLRILGYVTEEIEGSGRTINFNMQMDTEYYFELTMRNGVVRLYNLNNNGNRIEELFESVDIGNANENYFKAGCYLQSTSSSHENSNVYGQVLIKDLVVSPDN